MNLLALAEARVPGLVKKTATEWAGPCPQCGGSDRFVVTQKTDGEVWYCRGCQQSGGAVAFLRLCGVRCHDAHQQAGQTCTSRTCPATRCPARSADLAPAAVAVASLRPPAPAAAAPAFIAVEASAPAAVWQERAAKLVDFAHPALLEQPAAMAFLAARGLPLAAVQRYRLGWLATPRYRPRAAWGLPEQRRQDGKPKQLYLPAGLVIPTLDPAGTPVRLRIRRGQPEPGQPRYYHVPGSGNDLVLVGSPAARAVVVVESDLDALLVHHAAGDLVAALPLTTVAAKPKAHAAAVLDQALAILVALDVDANQAGGKASRWWLEHYPRARRWPVPAGKDPGEYVEHHRGDLRAWVLAGLPPIFHVTAAAGQHPTPTPAAPFATAPRYLRGTSREGIAYLIADTPDELAAACAENPGHVPFLREEIERLRGYTPAQAHAVLLAKQAFPEGCVVAGPGGRG